MNLRRDNVLHFSAFVENRRDEVPMRSERLDEQTQTLCQDDLTRESFHAKLGHSSIMCRTSKCCILAPCVRTWPLRDDCSVEWRGQLHTTNVNHSPQRLLRCVYRHKSIFFVETEGMRDLWLQGHVFISNLFHEREREKTKKSTNKMGQEEK